MTEVLKSLDTPKAILLGLVMIATVMLFNGITVPNYMVAGTNRGALVMDTKTAQWRMCSPDYCTEWFDGLMEPDL